MSCNRRAGQINKHAELTVLYEIERVMMIMVMMTVDVMVAVTA